MGAVVNSASIVIVTQNRYDDLVVTAESLRDVDTSLFDFVELVIVDNGSTDNTHKARDWGFSNFIYKYIYEPVPGKCGALNIGIAASKGDILVFTDDDVRFESDWLQELTFSIRENTTDACVGEIIIASCLERAWMTNLHRACLAETVWIDKYNPKYMIGANMAFKRIILDIIPGFDVDTGPGKLGFGDDTLLSLQLIEAGFRIQFCESAVVEHHFQVDRLLHKSWLKRAYNAGMTQAYIDYNWFHKDYAGKKILFEYLRMKLRSIRQGWRVNTREGISESEFYYYHNKGYRNYFNTNRNVSRKYDYKGLVKK
ncbi:glycosyltransferase [Armatimonas sp.]|uniref:glycosyltransferase n=1 Tax=Armatimonas sp. TaxID=1872638 RepID=UPI00375389C1